MVSELSKRLMEFNKDLLPGMVEIKYRLMSEDIFGFFRGTAPVFYEDLSKAKNFPDSPVAWLCGDLHIENFGSFRANNRLVYFDLNDFDESARAPLCWELSRFLTSIFVAFGSLKIAPREARKAAKLFIKIYRDTLICSKSYYIDPRTAKGVVKGFLKKVKKRQHTDLVEKILDPVSKRWRIKTDDKNHFKIERDLEGALVKHMSGWITNTSEWPNNYEVKDVCFRVAGVGSVGLKRYMFLLQSTKHKNKAIVVEMKEGRPSALASHISVKQPKWETEAERIITIQQRMQNVSPALLSPTIFKGDTYILQEMQPAADKIKFEIIEDRHNDLELTIKDMAMLAASAALRSGGIQGSAIIDSLAAFGARDDWEKPLLEYATEYSKQISSYYKQYLNDYHNGNLAVTEKGK